MIRDAWTRALPLVCMCVGEAALTAVGIDCHTGEPSPFPPLQCTCCTVSNGRRARFYFIGFNISHTRPPTAIHLHHQVSSHNSPPCQCQVGTPPAHAWMLNPPPVKRGLASCAANCCVAAIRVADGGRRTLPGPPPGSVPVGNPSWSANADRRFTS